MVNITRSKPRKNTTWRSKQAASTAPHVLIRSRGAAIPAIQWADHCGIAHSSPNLTTISGRPAFPGAHPTERIAAILSKDPPPLGLTVSPIVQRALAKDRNARYQSASAMLSDLLGLSESDESASASMLPQTLAVLDFRNLSRQTDDDWIGSGVAESVAADLARAPGLIIVGREKLLAAARRRV